MRQNMEFKPSEKDLADIRQQIATLKMQAEQSKVESKEAFETQLRAVEDQYDLMVARLNKLNMQTGKVGKELSNGVSQAWKSLQDSFESAKQYLH